MKRRPQECRHGYRRLARHARRHLCPQRRDRSRAARPELTGLQKPKNQTWQVSVFEVDQAQCSVHIGLGIAGEVDAPNVDDGRLRALALVWAWNFIGAADSDRGALNAAAAWRSRKIAVSRRIRRSACASRFSAPRSRSMTANVVLAPQIQPELGTISRLSAEPDGRIRRDRPASIEDAR